MVLLQKTLKYLTKKKTQDIPTKEQHYPKLKCVNRDSTEADKLKEMLAHSKPPQGLVPENRKRFRKGSRSLSPLCQDQLGYISSVSHGLSLQAVC